MQYQYSSDASKIRTPDVRWVQALLTEFIGTCILVLSILLSGAPEKCNVTHFFAVGGALCAMIYSMDHISQAHFNPAMTLGSLLSGRISWRMSILYVILQTLGGMAGGLLAGIIAGPQNLIILAPSSLGPGFAVEVIYTAALVLVAQNACMEKNTREPNSYFGLAVSFTVIAGAAAVGPISGGCFNPAVGTGIQFATLLRGGSMDTLWVYWVAPPIGAIIATAVRIYMNLPMHQDAEGLPWVVPVTEGIGTYFVVLTAALTGEGLAVGSMLLAMVYMGDHVCGADYNPAVTLGVAIRMGVPWKEYWKVGVTLLSQFVGAFLAALTAYGVAGGTLQYPASDMIHGVIGAVVFETIWTSLLVYVVCAVMTATHGDEDMQEERRGHSRSYQGLAIGFVVAAGIYCATQSGGGSGGVFNPALGSAIMSIDAALNGKSIANIWIYLVGPFAGSFIGAGLFTILHYHRDPMMLDYEVVVEANPYGNANLDRF